MICPHCHKNIDLKRGHVCTQFDKYSTDGQGPAFERTCKTCGQLWIRISKYHKWEKSNWEGKGCMILI